MHLAAGSDAAASFSMGRRSVSEISEISDPLLSPRFYVPIPGLSLFVSFEL
jgi:hypothetical protein